MEEALIAKPKKSRVWEIDFLRGFCIILMMLDHLFFDFMEADSFAEILFSNYGQIDGTILINLFDLGSWWWVWPVRVGLHYMVAGLFFALSGISCTFSRNNWIHSLKLIGAGLVLTLITYIAYSIAGNPNRPGSMISIFNVLTVMGFGSLIVSLLRLIRFKYRAHIFIIVGLIIFIVCVCFNLYSISLIDGSRKWFYSWPKPADWWALLVGVECWGSDYFPPIPYLAYTLIGAGLGEIIYKERKSLLPKLDGKWHKPVSFIGRHTIWFYLGHQVVFGAILIVIALCIGYRF